MDLFIDPEQEITIKFAVAKKPNGEIAVDLTPEALRADLGDDTKAEGHSATFRYPRFEDTVLLNAGTVVMEGERLRFNPSQLRLNRVKFLLKSWTLDRPATAESVSNLHDSIGQLLGNELEKVISG